jgi:hypothetical protein
MPLIATTISSSARVDLLVRPAPPSSLILRRAFLLAAVAVFLVAIHPARAAASGIAAQQSPAGNFDGPAELPRRYVKTSLADTPAPGSTRMVKEGEDLQQAINDAKCGDTLKLQAGASFQGLYRFPKKSCDDAHWIIVRSSAPDDALPPENTILTPCYAGIASLPGRPDFHCSSVRNVMAKLELAGKADTGPILFEAGANHYRFVGLEITRAPGARFRNLVEAEETADHLVFDRLWLHGTAQEETKGGIHLSGTTEVGIVDSFFTDFHCIAKSGSCIDSQAINGGTGDQPGGPYKIVNNFLEAAGESIMFGGARGSTTPSDIEIRHNHFFKPLLWKPGYPGFVGATDGNPFIVKNCIELKNAQRVLLEGNILENAWGGFSQAGIAVVLMPANQSGHCPECRLTDVTLRYNRISHVGGGVGIGNTVGKAQAPSSGGERYSLHDLVFDDIDPESYQGFGLMAMIVSTAPPVYSVHFDHVTAFPPRGLFTIKNTGEKLRDISFTNSIFTVGDRGVWGAAGGRENCTQGLRDPTSILQACFANPIFKNNLVIGGPGGWPQNNMKVKNGNDAGFRDFHQGNGGDYRLCRKKDEGPGCKAESPALGKAADGKDVGADMPAVELKTAGII